MSQRTHDIKTLKEKFKGMNKFEMENPIKKNTFICFKL